MMNANRRFTVARAEGAGDLAEKLTEHTWCLCTGFILTDCGRELLYLNDSFGADGAQEYAVYQNLGDGQYQQVESITFSWCTEYDALRHICELHRNDLHMYGAPQALTVQNPEDHGSCRMCA